MASYTIEDIELIRRKSSISYQEAVALLDYHNGNVARALIDLERNGRIKSDDTQPKKTASHNTAGVMNLFQRLYRFRLKVKKGDVSIVNLSMLFSLLAVLVSPHLVIIGAILVLVLGYKVSFDRNDPDFAKDNLDKMVRNAAQNVKSTVNDVARSFTGDAEKPAQPQAPEEPMVDAPTVEVPRPDFYQSNPAATTYRTAYTGAAPTLQVPVQVETHDGKVTIASESDGHSTATIE